ncbi:MAG: hypothetical protein E6J91_13655 [Deltaproteobacteria bacterium]|nr:MAG: hypothetical protein E6J91_13655 [Deltaproteobacteria bacterium]
MAAARRVFGRFDAGLNVASLHNGKLYPDGPPARGAHPDWPATVAAARRRARGERGAHDIGSVIDTS